MVDVDTDKIGRYNKRRGMGSGEEGRAEQAPDYGTAGHSCCTRSKKPKLKPKPKGKKEKSNGETGKGRKKVRSHYWWT